MLSVDLFCDSVFVMQSDCICLMLSVDVVCDSVCL